MDKMRSRGMSMDEDMRPDMEEECEKLEQEIADYEKLKEKIDDKPPTMPLNSYDDSENDSDYINLYYKD